MMSASLSHEKQASSYVLLILFGAMGLWEIRLGLR